MGTTLKVKRVNHDAPTPRYQHDGDAGLDLSSMETVWVYPGRTEMVRTGIAIELERGYVGLVFPRSGLGSKGLTLSNCVCVIDSGYRGEIRIPLHNNNRDGAPMLVSKGDRVCQLVVVKLPSVAIEEVAELADSERGTSGFGSTGV
ncbi:MAG: dUTP diphosphatase [Atopobiaceae bacterium]|nr:dUTP diphosphatase [Atopobiaceae bacterium]